MCTGMVHEATGPNAGADTAGAGAIGDCRGAAGAEADNAGAAAAGFGASASVLRQAGSQSLVKATLPVKFNSGATRRSPASSYVGTA